MVGRHRVEARKVGVLGDVVEAEADIVRKVRRIGAVDDAGLKGGEDLVEVHHDRGRAEILEDQGRHARR